MACVITDVPEQRIYLQKEIKQLYNKRSRIVHGGLNVDFYEAEHLRDRSRELTIEAWTGLIGRHSNLIGADTNDFTAFVLGKS